MVFNRGVSSLQEELSKRRKERKISNLCVADVSLKARNGECLEALDVFFACDIGV